MIIAKREITELSENVRKIIDGKNIDIRDNSEGVLSILKNDIHTLAFRLSEQADILQTEKESLKNTIADIAHQLKTPLTSMMIMAELLSDENLSAEKRAEFTENISESLVRMEWLVSALLKMAKLDAGAVEFKFEHVSAAALIETALQPLQIPLDIKNQRVITETADTADILCDKKWTAEALTNIIKNASEHTPENGEIHFVYGKNPICSFITVADSGKGIPNVEIPLLWKRFSRGGKNGYGIGLPLSLSIMRRMNGDIEVDGGNGKSGAVFTLKFYK